MSDDGGCRVHDGFSAGGWRARIGRGRAGRAHRR
jgi:hypothetical protein